jgi:hypothetical protein
MVHIKFVKTEKKMKPVVSPEQIGQILKQFDRRTFHGTRDYCMIAAFQPKVDRIAFEIKG